MFGADAIVAIIDEISLYEYSSVITIDCGSSKTTKYNVEGDAPLGKSQSMIAWLPISWKVLQADNELLAALLKLLYTLTVQE